MAPVDHRNQPLLLPLWGLCRVMSVLCQSKPGFGTPCLPHIRGRPLNQVIQNRARFSWRFLCTESFGQHDSLLNVNHGEENGGEHSCTEAAPSIQTCHRCRFNNSPDPGFGGMESPESGGRRGRGEMFLLLSSVRKDAAVCKLAEGWDSEPWLASRLNLAHREPSWDMSWAVFAGSKLTLNFIDSCLLIPSGEPAAC